MQQENNNGFKSRNKKMTFNKKKRHNSKPKSKSYKKNKSAFKECAQHWPETFNINEARPLCEGINTMLYEDAASRGIEITQSKIYSAIYWLTKTYQYQKALSLHTHRYDIHGEKVSEISPEHKQNAIARMNEIKEAKKREKEQNKAKRPMSLKTTRRPTVKIMQKSKRRLISTPSQG